MFSPDLSGLPPSLTPVGAVKAYAWVVVESGQIVLTVPPKLDAGQPPHVPGHICLGPVVLARVPAPETAGEPSDGLPTPEPPSPA